MQQENQRLEEDHATLERELGEAKHAIECERDKCQELAAQLEEKESALCEVRESLERVEVTLEQQSAEHVAEIEALQRDATLDRYKALETMQAKWEAREGRLIAQMESLKCDHRSGVADSEESLADQLKEAKTYQNRLIVQLSEAKMKVNQLEGTKVSQDQEIEELRAEVTFLKAKLKGAERVSSHPITREPVLNITSPLVSPLSPHTTSPVSTSSSRVTWATSDVLSTSVVPHTCNTSEVASRPIATTMSAPPLSLSGGDCVSLPTPLTTSTVSARLSGTTPISTATAPVSTAAPFLLTANYMPLATSVLSQLPQIPRFTGEETSDGETFEDWLEQFESVAELGGWNGHAKLVNLTARLRGGAYSFFRSCTPEQHSSYPLLVAELKKRFTPVQLTAIQTQLFHGRVQGAKESVDEFAQALRKLFSKAYSTVLRGGPEANSMGQVVLANQFISGLRSDLKAKVVGKEGNLEQLLVKARFEEAKKRELATNKGEAPPPPPPRSLLDHQVILLHQRIHQGPPPLT